MCWLQAPRSSILSFVLSNAPFVRTSLGAALGKSADIHPRRMSMCEWLVSLYQLFQEIDRSKPRYSAANATLVSLTMLHGRDFVTEMESRPARSCSTQIVPFASPIPIPSLIESTLTLVCTFNFVTQHLTIRDCIRLAADRRGECPLCCVAIVKSPDQLPSLKTIQRGITNLESCANFLR